MSTNDGRLTVDINGNWRLYTQTIPKNSTPLGTVTRGGYDTGALVRLASGVYVQVNAGVIRRLDGRKVAAALGTAGRPPKMGGGGRINVYLDAASVEAARRLGEGNVSLGIRRAIEACAQLDADEAK